MFTTIFSFLGGAVFRMMFGAVMGHFEKKQEHTYEIERMKVSAELEDKAHARRQEAIAEQHKQGIQTIAVQAEANTSMIEAQGWANAVSHAFATPTGIFIVDLWNGIIRPSAATISIVLWVLALNAQSWRMEDWDKELVGVILGFFFASREMNKRGK